jgi:antibiotic biosynthesis monooxygenase (ABM) superfamily enzyme
LGSSEDANVDFDARVPVTTIVSQKIKPGLEEQFETWLHDVVLDAMAFEGHLGVNVIRPGPRSLEYTAVFRFRSPAALRGWLESDVRARRLREAEALCDGAATMQRLTGLETWFSLPDRPALAPPPRYKMAITSFIAVFPLGVVVPRVAAPLVEPMPPLARVLAESAMTIGLMTYVVMPALTRLLFRWLYPIRPN